jgi:endoglucanase
MKKQILLGISLSLFLLSACAGQPAINTAVPTPSQPVVDTPTLAPSPPSAPTSTPTATVAALAEADRFAFEQNTRLGRGVNLGNALEAPVEGEWGVTLEEGYFDLIQEAGFDSVRVPIRWNAHADENAPYTIDPALFERVDWVVEQAAQRELAVVINIHHYEEIMENPRVHKERFLAIWEQISQHYQKAPDSVFFELLNEPYGTIASTSWNQFIADAIQVIRKTNARRTIILGPGNWNSIGNLYELDLPETERNLIITVHYYSPFQFTHQGAEWADNMDIYLGTQWTGSLDEKKAVDQNFDMAAKWSSEYKRPIFLGEFGAYSKADSESRHLWTDYIARSAEKRGFSWAYWEFCAGFGVYDPAAAAWNEPILTALIP